LLYTGRGCDRFSFLASIYANVFDDEDGEVYTLIWFRPTAAGTYGWFATPRPARAARPTQNRSALLAA